MYVGNLEQWQDESRNLPEFLSPYIKKLAAFDFDALTAGRYELGGLNYMNVDEAETAPAANRQIECHRRYVDVQVLLDGEEVIGYQPLSRLGAMTEDRGSKDAYFYNPPAENDFILLMEARKTVAVFFPTDGHRCLCAPAGKGATVRKAVMKIAVPGDE